MKCKWLALWYNIRYMKLFLLKGYFASGHQFEFTGETHEDHWELKCTSCDTFAGSEVRPEILHKEAENKK